MNPYDILEISKDSTPEEIKAKYKSLAQQHHPDRGGDENIFKQIKEAYELLIDPIRKELYDKTGNFGKHQNLRGEALEQLSRLFLHIIDSMNPDIDNLIIIMKNKTRSEMSAVNGNIETCKNHLKKLETIAKKIRKRNEGENLLQMFTQNQLNIRANELHNFYRRIQVLEHMLSILEEYQYGELVDLLPAA
jgi:curved DNA-binding protein CbpA